MSAEKRAASRAKPKPPALHIAMISPEIAPFAKTGGLGEVLGSLPQALEKAGLRVTLITPAYRSVLHDAFPLEDTGMRISVPVSDRMEEAIVLKGKVGKAIPVYFVRSDKYFDRDGLYYGADGDYTDNAERFTFFSRVALEILKSDPPAILQAHDWQSALSIVFLETQPERYPELDATRTLFTIHNLGYQGMFWRHDWHLLNLDWRFFSPPYLEFYDKINFLKGGIVFADGVSTVSPTYADEIETAVYGFGLEGIFQSREKETTGILNGIDYRVWNPETDTIIAHTYSGDDLTGKAVCRASLQKLFGLQENPDVPLIGMVTRLTSQKGCDLLEAAMSTIMARNVQFVLLGSGEKRYADLFSGMPAQYPGRMGVQVAFDEAKVHTIIAGADFLLIPSRYEPCGLTQLYGMRYGTPAVARATGGLKDTIQEFNAETKTGNGFLFGKYEAGDFIAAIDLALDHYEHKDEWNALVRNAMKASFSWDKSARAYRDLYQKLVRAPLISGG